MLLSSILLMAIHAVVIGISLWGLKKAMDCPSEPSDHRLTMDVLIPFRNERQNLVALLSDIKAQRSLNGIRLYFIDDHSTDGSKEFVSGEIRDLPAQVLSSTGDGKKDALMTGFDASSQKYLLTMDADVRLPSDYFFQIARLPADPDMIILPVLPIVKGGLIERCAALDFLSLIGMTFATAGMGKPVMANGANLLRKRKAFHVDPTTTSGDDVQNLHALKENGAFIAWSTHPSLVVRTAMPSRWKEVFQQRLRWASKSSAYRDRDTLRLGWYTLLHQTGFILLIGLAVFKDEVMLAVLLFISKSVVELTFLSTISRYFKLSGLLWVFPIALIMNIIMYPLIFVASRRPYTWKDRTYTR